MPKAKTAHLIVREIDDETLVYDMGRHAATCLNEFAAKVWRRCDGTTSVADIADALGEDERAVWLALHRLNKSQLLTEAIALPPDMRTGKTRRQIAGQLGLGAPQARSQKSEIRNQKSEIRSPIALTGGGAFFAFRLRRPQPQPQSCACAP
jgi:hypothetical protein